MLLNVAVLMSSMQVGYVKGVGIGGAAEGNAGGAGYVILEYIVDPTYEGRWGGQSQVMT